MPETITDFDPDFAAPSEWAAMYRKRGLQVVPAKAPIKGGEWKMPALASWTEFQENLIPQATFDRWYGDGGDHSRRENMGILPGRSSSNVCVLDLDDQKGPEAQAWWVSLLEVHNSRIDLETVQQHTGGGGRQKLFRAPMDWVAPTNKTTINVDIRGQGGFAMMPGSLHESGRHYTWDDGCAPWEMVIAVAPEWLLEAVDTLVAKHGSRPRTEKTASPGTEKNAFGTRIIEGREGYMRDMIWRVVLKWYRECPIGPPPAAESTAKRDEAWLVYESCVGTRIVEDGLSNADGLERENRGYSMFANKWRREMKNWGSPKMMEAAKHDPKPDEAVPQPPPIDPATGQPVPLILTSKQFADTLQPPAYIIDGIIQRGFLYSLTARTGHGKTAVVLRACAAVVRGEEFAGCTTRKGSVLFFAGENPQDVRARYVAMCDQLGIDTDTAAMYFVDGRIDIGANLARIRIEAGAIPDLRLIVVDTAAAYFPGDDGNSNAQLGAYAGLLRQLTFLPSLPTGIVNCHPVKNANSDNLLPMGGSAFVNEVDGNLTLWADDDKATTMHWQGKFRGPEFNPISFELKEITSTKVVNEDGECMPTVMAVFMPENVAERREAVGEDEDNIVLRLIHADKHATRFIRSRQTIRLLQDEGKPDRQACP